MDQFKLTLRSVRNGIQFDVSVGLDTLYVTQNKGNKMMVTLRSAVVDSGYIATIKAQDW